ncbi:MAG: alkaline phosphatase family protein [Ignavibacteriales bacterium]|nr:alkaline phosphatase family protein [Ignavibacteriales bacterium]
MSKNNVLLIFVDGVGIGKKDPECNPFFKYRFKMFEDIFGSTPHLDNQYLNNNNKYLFPVDACMGVPELPQSGTGQASIFCGVNAPKILGQHFGPYPHSKLLPTLKEKNIFHEFMKRGLKVTFSNAYPQTFFDYVNSGRQRLSVTTLSCIMSGLRLNNYNDLKKGKALSSDIDNFYWVERLGYRLSKISPKRAAKRLIKLTKKNNLTVYEFFLTDHLGHGRNAAEFEYIIKKFDEFIYSILSQLPKKISLVICSDHGNFEDISIKSHTTNPALGITAGAFAKELSAKIKNLSDIKPAILELFD